MTFDPAHPQSSPIADRPNLRRAECCQTCVHWNQQGAQYCALGAFAVRTPPEALCDEWRPWVRYHDAFSDAEEGDV